MELVFFGTSGAVPTAQDGNVSFLVEAEGRSLLVDLSGNPVRNLLRAGSDPLHVDAVILSHAHPDHLYALPSLVQSLRLLRREKPLRLITNPATAERAQELLSLFKLVDRKEMFDLIWETEVGAPLRISTGFGVQLIPVEHSRPTCGMRVTAGAAVLVNSSDTAPCPAVAEAAAGAAALIHESSGSDLRAAELNEAGHSSGAQAGQIAARAGVKTLFLCHFDRTPGAADSTPGRMKGEARGHFGGRIVIPRSFRRYRV